MIPLEQCFSTFCLHQWSRFPFLTPLISPSVTSEPYFSSFRFWSNLSFSSFLILYNLPWSEKMIQELPFEHERSSINHCVVQSREMNWSAEIKYLYSALKMSTKPGNFENIGKFLFLWTFLHNSTECKTIKSRESFAPSLLSQKYRQLDSIWVCVIVSVWSTCGTIWEFHLKLVLNLSQTKAA